MCDAAKEQYYNNKINESEANSKELFNLCKGLLHREKVIALPTHSSSTALANEFARYFRDKIEKIRHHLSIPTSAEQTQKPTTLDIEKMRGFNEVTEEELEKIILSGNSKSCCLDPLPTKVLKLVLPALLPSLTSIVNKSLTQSKMPSSLKQAAVTPLLKKPSLDKENNKNYRPVSNLPYVGKCIEKAAIHQMDKHLSQNNLNEPLQSAYKQHHSTETALVKVTNDILLALDDRQCVYLVLLDLSAAFDTIDHQVFLRQMDSEYGMSGGIVQWMKSYLEGRKQRVHISESTSDDVDIQYGFPQGSCIGPFGFKLYTKQLTSIAHRHGVDIHLYADDTQLVKAFHPNDSKSAMDQLEGCIEEIRQWMAAHYLKLNDGKTEFMILGTSKDVEKVQVTTVNVGGVKIPVSPTARNIGAYLDTEMNMRTHLNNMIRSCYCQLRSIARIRRYLSIESSHKLCHAFITSRIDHMNSLLFKIPDCHLQKLQLIQNNAARVIKRLRKFDHITPVLMELHWLPVTQRIIFKILLLVFKCHIQNAPLYLMDMIKPHTLPRVTRSTDPNQHRLKEREAPCNKQYGERAFSVCGPKLWNNLPLHIRQSQSLESFKNNLKTLLFEQAFK